MAQDDNEDDDNHDDEADDDGEVDDGEEDEQVVDHDDEEEDDDHNVVAAIMSDLIQELSSSKLDVVNRNVRTARMEEAMQLLQTSRLARTVLASTTMDDINHQGITCSSPHAYQRIVDLFCTALCTSSTSTTMDSVDGKDNNNDNNNSITLRIGLWRGLCAVLQQSQQIALIERVLMHLKHFYSTITPTTIPSSSKDASKNEEEESKEDNENKVQAQHQQLQKRLQQDLNFLLDIAKTTSRFPYYAPAWSLVSMMMTMLTMMTTTSPKEPSKMSVSFLTDVVLPKTLGITTNTTMTIFPSSSDLIMARPYWNTLTVEQFITYMLPVLGKKLKANPESVLETVLEIATGWTSTTTTTNIPRHQQARPPTSSTSTTSATTLPSSTPSVINRVAASLQQEEIISSLFKLMKSTKPKVRDLAKDILVALAKSRDTDAETETSEHVEGDHHAHGNSGIANTSSLPTWLVVAEALANDTTFTVPEARLGLYQALEDMGRFGLLNGTTTTRVDATANTSVASLMTGFMAQLAKETSSSSSSSFLLKDAGWNALWQWMMVAKQSQATEGYDKAIQYLRQPLLDATTVSATEFTNRIISLLRCTTAVTSDVKESILLDMLLRDDNKGAVDKALVNLVDTASTKKQAISGGIALEGIVAIYLLLLSAESANNNNHKSSKAPLATLKPNVLKTITSGSSSSVTATTSFLFQRVTLDAISTNPIVGQTLMPNIIAMYTKLLAKQQEENGPSADFRPLITTKETASLATQALALSLLHATATTTSMSQLTSSGGPVFAALQTILTCQPTVAPAILNALFHQVNRSSLQHDEWVVSLNSSRQAREAEEVTKPRYSAASQFHPGFDPSAVGRAAQQILLSSAITSGAASAAVGAIVAARALLLMHIGTSLRSSGRQRRELIKRLAEVMEHVVLPLADADADESFLDSLADALFQMTSMASLVVPTSSSDKESSSSSPLSETPPSQPVSRSLHEAGLSLLTSLGSIAANFDPLIDDGTDDASKVPALAHNLCVNELAKRFAARTKTVLLQIEELTDYEIELYKSPKGVLCRGGPDASTDAAKKSTNAEKKREVGKSRKTRGDFGAEFEDEEWERQLKKELAEKKSGSGEGASTTVLTEEEKKLVVQQDEQRERLTALIDGDFIRVLATIRSLCLSDIEVGNASLPLLSPPVLVAATSESKAFMSIRGLRDASFAALSTLASCVYEIDDKHAPSMARALIASCRRKATLNGNETATSSDEANFLTISELPSPCPAAACTISEMDDFGDKLSGPSFSFLLPVVRAALTGPRTSPGCEGALRVLEVHTPLLAGEEVDPVVSPLRKEMVTAVLELLRHDRAQTFQDPTSFDTLVSCYQTDDQTENQKPVLSSAELAPLLNERGALGPKNCRVGALVALGSIASEHPKLVKSNPLVENRVWINCFAGDESIRNAARKTWRIACGADGADDDELPPPSPFYAISLLPLLSHADASIASAVATSYAYGMGLHPTSVDRNIQKLCTTYIESFPKDAVDSGKVSKTPAVVQPKPAAGAAAKKKPIVTTGLKKKPVAVASPLAIAGIGKPKVVKKKSVSAALLKPKEERTLGKEEWESQFRNESIKSDPETDSPTKIVTRRGVIRVISSLTTSAIEVTIELDTLKLLTSFLMAFALADFDDALRSEARDALRDVVATKGSSDQSISFLLPILEKVLSTGVADLESLGSLPIDKVPRDVTASDRRKEGVVVALGSAALHIKGPENDSKIDTTIDLLISTLKTPSEDVQSSVAACLEKLMKKGKTQDRVGDLLANMMNDCLSGDKLATRRGAAYGISAIVKGSGIATLKKFEIVKQLEEACTNGSPSGKEGSLFAIELLSDRLGLLFEPYVIVLLPSLLRAFSDTSDHVRRAATHTADLIMSKLSAHGVKLVMPAVLTAFEDPSWRTKQASIHMLGSMSHLAPKQLASALPKVVPQLTEAFSDTHPKVKSSAQEALDEISKVVKNPEVSSISPVLLKALTDPADGTQRALQALIQTEFLHAIDAPSLALILPIVQRGLRDRAATTKRYSALIAGNICTMINDPRDFLPYLPALIQSIKAALLDPIPDVRTTSAKSLGSLTRTLGENNLDGLRTWLTDKLRDEAVSSAERSGAAQGFTEMLIAVGGSTVEEVMNSEILPLRSHPQASTREGVLWTLTFLPPSLGQAYTPLIDVSLPALIGGLSDDSEMVREVAMRAGRVLIKSHGKVHVDKILPSLEIALDDDDHRIRVAALSLLGDLLSMIGGTTIVKGDGDTQDDIRRAERAQAQIALILGVETRKRVLSRLYLARSDLSSSVRQNALQVWKTVVSVTARTLREIVPVLVARIVESLASGNPERTVVAARCVGDLVSKLGDSVLPDVIPVLRNALYQGDKHTRRGVCVGLSEVIQCSTKEQILKYVEIIVKVVQDALCDEDQDVRKVAASSFQSLYSVVGNRAMDEVVPALMVALETGDLRGANTRARALNGLTGILSIRSRDLLPYLVPRLIQRPITKNHADALAGIAKVTGTTISAHFNSIIPAMIGELANQSGDSSDEARENAIRDAVRSICLNVDESGCNLLISEAANKCNSDKAEIRKESCWMFETVITERKDLKDFYGHIPVMIRELLYRLNDENADVLKATNLAFTALSNYVPSEELVNNVEFMRNLIASIVSDARRRKGGVGDGEFLLPGFNIPKGLEPLLPIFQRGILYGTPTIREVSAAGLGETLALTSSKYLAGPVVIKMTGPLLRIVGDRNPPNVKIAILQTLGLILTKGGPALRAFVPQFQTTFVKALSDPSRQVRLEAIHALALLMPLSTRVDPLIKELVTGSLGKGSNIAATAATGETAALAAVQTATLLALAEVLKSGGSKAKLPESISSALDAGKSLLQQEDEGLREAAAKVVGCACELVGLESTTSFIRREILDGNINDDANTRHGKVCTIRRILSEKVAKKLDPKLTQELTNLILTLLNDDKSSVQEEACVAVGAAVGSAADPASRLRQVEPALLKFMKNSKERMEVHKAVAKGLVLALVLADVEDGVAFFGKDLLDATLQLAMSGSQRVQFAYNDVLWLALNVPKGDEGLEAYAKLAYFDNVKAMRSLHSKVLSRIKNVTILDD